MRPLILITAVAAFAQVRALPVTGSEQECADPPARIEWRELDPVDQKGYIDAVLCLKTKPSRIGLDTPLYDDFAYVHFTLAQVSKLTSTSHQLPTTANGRMQSMAMRYSCLGTDTSPIFTSKPSRRSAAIRALFRMLSCET